jgi:hypothetical protein
MIELPSIRRAKFPTDVVLDLVVVLGSLAFATLGALARFPPAGSRRWQDWAGLWAFIVVAVVVFACLILKSIRSYRKSRKYEPPEQPQELAMWASTLHQQLRSLRKDIGEHDGSIRVTILKVHRHPRHGGPDELEQIVDYVGGPGGKVGRRLSARAGVSGAAARLNRPHPIGAQRKSMDESEAVQEFIRRWGFTHEEALQLSPGRRAWMSVPIFADGRAIGVVYLDSGQADIFVADGQKIANAVIAQCKHLVNHVARLYGGS